MAKDYYDILGVSKDASPEEVKRAFRKQAHKLHPDKKGGDEARFKELNEAYQVIGNADKRKQYDQFGQTFDSAGGSGGAQGFHGFGQNPFGGQAQGQGVNFDFGDMGDVFETFFGGARSRGRSRAHTGADIQTDIEISFEESVFGVKKDIRLYKSVVCEKCHGNRAEPGTKINTCSMCKGSGQVEQVRSTILGQIRTASVCPQCRGEGKSPATLCTRCEGRGVEKKNSEISIDIPGGISDGEALRLSDQGEAGEDGGGYGDLFVRIHVKESREFTRDGNDIRSDVTIPFTDAALGGEIAIKTADGDGTLKIPEGTHSEKEFRIRGKGFKKLQSTGRGDFIVTVHIEAPKKLSRKAKKLLQELRDELS